MNITQHDKNILRLAVLLTVGPLAIILAVAGLTSWNVSGTVVFMVMGWFFGAVMTWAYGKFQRRKINVP